MNTLIVGHFKQLSDAETTARALRRAGFQSDGMCVVYVNPHGQHAIHPMGGDEDESPGTHEASYGAIAGAAGGVGAGTLVGIVALPVLGPAGPLLGAAVGAYTGALVGALKNMDEEQDESYEAATTATREPGVLLAVAVETSLKRENAIEILREYTDELEEVEGTVRDGDWVDFDPLLPGQTIK